MISDRSVPRPPALARAFGYAGLLPQAAVVMVLASGSSWWRFAALSAGFAYAALILSFVGGLWWGLTAQRGRHAASWMWVAAVVPNLVAFATFVPWMIGAAWPGPSLYVLGLALLGSLFVDRRLALAGVAPDWWMALRVPLSTGLGVLTLIAALFA